MHTSSRFLGVTSLLLALACLDSQGIPVETHGTPGINSSGTGTGTGGHGTNQSVSVGDDFFAPDSLTINLADTVTWTWIGQKAHSVLFGDGIGSGVRTSGSFSRFFGTPGSYPYTSTVVGDTLMRGLIVVR